jgi:hypothetical protein
MNTGRERVYCDALPTQHMPLREPMTQCSSYEDKTRPQMYEMEAMAWMVTTDRKTKQIGFKSPTELEKDKRFIE